MKAAVYYELGTPDVFRYEDVPDPACPDNGVVIDVEAISIEGGDTLHRLRGPIGPTPHIVGYQCAGVVSEVGSSVRERKLGQRVVAVMMNGSHAERVAVPELMTWAIPEGADLERAACVPVAIGTAADCLFEHGHLQRGETVLVHAGAGGVGMAAIQLAKRAGAIVITTASSADKLARLQQLGADHGIDYKTQDFVMRTLELTQGRGAQLVVDSIGGKTLEQSFNAAGYRGRIVSVGSAGRDDYRPDTNLLRPGNKSLTGVFLGAELVFDYKRVHPMIAALIDDVAHERVQVIIDRRYPLAKAADAHRYIESRAAFGRVLLVP